MMGFMTRIGRLTRNLEQVEMREEGESVWH